MFTTVTSSLLATINKITADTTLWFVGASARHGRGHGHADRQPPGHHEHAHRHQGHGHGHAAPGGGGDGLPSAPEIDVSQGAAALVIVLLAFLLLREIYLRQRPAV